MSKTAPTSGVSVPLPDRIMLATGWRRLAVAALAGAVSALAMPPFSLWPVLALTFPVLVWLIDGAAIAGGRGWRGAFTAGWWFGAGYFLAGLWWIGNAFLVQADVFAWLLPVAVLILPAGLAIFTGLGCLIARLLWCPGPCRFLALAIGLTIADWLRGTVLTGFPWNSFGYALSSDLNFAQSSAVWGLWGLSFITVATLASPAALLATRAYRRERFAAPFLAILVLAGLWAGGAWRLAATPIENVPGVRLRIMQPDLPQDQKFRYDARRSVVDRYIETSQSQGGLDGITHLFWPESAFPFFLEREPEALLRIADLLPPGTVLVTGAARMAAPEAGRTRPSVFNSLRAIGTDGAILATADKVHLVPFGEYLPFQEFLESLGLEQLTRVRGGFSAARERRPLSIPGLPSAIPLICYEAIFPGQLVTTPDASRAGVLINISNDAWFGITPGPYQHFEQARLRTVEEGLPMIRATNNGISAIVDPLGRITEILPLGVRGVVDGALPAALSATIYSRIGNLIPLLFVFFAIAIIFTTRRTYTRIS